MSQDKPYSFDDIYTRELETIRQGRESLARQRGVEPGNTPNTDQPGKDAPLVGLALSGGGIRSATFSLGVLQGLAQKKWLEKIDYLSTVSGGGYIGSWLSALIQREGHGHVEDIQQDIPPVFEKKARRENPAIHFLRDYSNYLTPKTGLLSTDTLSAVATYLRNLILNQTILVFALAFLFFLPLLYHNSSAAIPDSLTALLLESGIILLTLLLAITLIGLNLFFTRPEHRVDPAPWWTSQNSIVGLIVIPLLVAAATTTHLLLDYRATLAVIPEVLVPASAVLYALLWAFGGWIGNTFSPCRELDEADLAARRHARTRSHAFLSWYTLEMAVYTLIAGAIGGAGLWAAAWLMDSSGMDNNLLGWLASTFGISMITGIFSLTVIFHLGLAGRMFIESQREWWSRLGALLLTFLIGWAVLSSFAIFSPALLISGSLLLMGALTSGWLVSTIVGVMAARSGAGNDCASSPLLGRLVLLTPYIFITGLLALLALGIQAVLVARYAEQPLTPEQGCQCLSNILDHSLANLSTVAWPHLLAALFVTGAVTLLLSRRVNINLFSLHHFYRNRLTQCYLGATRGGKRRPHPFTGLDYRDDLPLSAIRQRPYQIINTAINFTKGEELAWQDRKATSFVFTPHFSGFQMPSTHSDGDDQPDTGYYRPTSEYAGSAGELTLGTALAISGAAVSPNQGFHTNPAVAFLLTVFNVRLGRWIGNPRKSHWKKSDPRMGLGYMAYELSGNGDLDADYVYLSDGGHFDNSGVYELIRRKCRLIILCDAGQDRLRTFDDLGNTIRKCRTDFGVNISIDLEQLRSGDDRHRSGTAWAEGEIDYGPYQEGLTGRIILIKPSLTLQQGEPVDILNYADANLDFPQQSTNDQWFDEAQFESYRQLGYFTVSNCPFFDDKPDTDQTDQNQPIINER